VSVQLADYIVSQSLQINNRCLRYLADWDVDQTHMSVNHGPVHAEAHTAYAESLLALDSRRLVSLWLLMRPAWKKSGAQTTAHVETLSVCAQTLTEATSTRRLALRLANSAALDQDAQAILTVARNLPAENPPAWDELNNLFGQDSHFWRKSRGFNVLDDAALQARVSRSYRKAYRLRNCLGEDVGAGEDRAFLAVKLHRWVQLSVHQLELLRSGLSDAGRAQLWYLDKLSDTLRTRADLQRLKQATVLLHIAPSARTQVEFYVDQQIGKMDMRIARLVKGAFSSKPKSMALALEQAVGDLGLRSVSLMQPAGVAVRPDEMATQQMTAEQPSMGLPDRE